ncbi:MAG: hypothetical protein JWP58_3284 [Hymenobacter sp.]|nr:hypothetical protein [Hymenobacter sp.]
MSTTLNGRARVQRTLAWLVGGLCLVLAFIVYGCAPPQHLQSAPRPARRYMEHRQHVHAQERRRQHHSTVTWSGQ